MVKKFNSFQCLVRTATKGKSLYYLHATSYTRLRTSYKRTVGRCTNSDTINPHWRGLDCSRQYATSTEAEGDDYEIDFISLTKKSKKPKFVDPNILKRRPDQSNADSGILGSTESRENLISDVGSVSKSVDLNLVIPELIEPAIVELKVTELNDLNIAHFVDGNLAWFDRLNDFSPNFEAFSGDLASRKLSNFTSLNSWSLDDNLNGNLESFVLTIGHYFQKNDANSRRLFDQYKISKAKSELLERGLWKYLGFLRSHRVGNGENIEIPALLDSIYQKWKELSENAYNDGRYPIIPEDLSISLFYLKQEQLNSILTSKVQFELEKAAALRQILQLDQQEIVNLVSYHAKTAQFNLNFETLLKPNVFSLIGVKKAAKINNFADSSIEDVISKLDVGLAMKFKTFVWKFAEKGYFLDSNLELVDNTIKSEFESVLYRQIPDDLDLFRFSDQLQRLRSYLGTSLGNLGTSFSDWSPQQVLNGLHNLTSGLTGIPMTPFFELHSKLKYLFDYNGGYCGVLDLLLTNEAVLSKVSFKSLDSDLLELLPSHIEQNISNYDLLVPYLASNYPMESISSDKLSDALMQFQNLYSFGKIPGIGTDHYQEWDTIVDYLLMECLLDDTIGKNLVNSYYSYKDKVRYYEEGLWKFVDEFKHLRTFINFKESKFSAIITAIKVEQVHLEKVIKRSLNEDWLYYAAVIRNEKYNHLIEFLNLRNFTNTWSLHDVANDDADEVYLRYFSKSQEKTEFLQNSDLITFIKNVPPRFLDYSLAALVELVKQRGVSTVENNPFLSLALEGVLHDCYVPHIILDSSVGMDNNSNAPYIQVPDDIDISSFAPELQILREQLGTSFASATPKEVYLAISEKIKSIANEPKHLLEDKLFRMRKLERKICQLFDTNNGNTKVLDLIILNHDAFAQFEQNLVSLKVPTTWNLEVIDSLKKAGVWKYLDELKDLNSRLRFSSTARVDILSSLQEIKPLQAPEIDDVWSRDYSSMFFAKYLKLERFKALEEVLSSVDSWTSNDLIYFVQDKVETEQLVSEEAKDESEEVILEAIDELVPEFYEFKNIVDKNIEFADLLLPELLSLLFANRDRECSVVLYHRITDMVERRIIYSTDSLPVDFCIEHMVWSQERLLRKERDMELFEEELLAQEEGGEFFEPNKVSHTETPLAETTAISYRQIPDEFRLEEFVPELKTLKNELATALFELVDSSKVMDVLFSMTQEEEKYGAALRNNYRKLLRNLNYLFKHNNGYTSVLDNVLKSQEVFSLFEISKANNKIDAALANILPSDSLVYDIITNQRDVISGIYDINQWKDYSLEDFASMDPKSYREKLLFAVDELKKSQLYLYPVTRDIVDKLLNLSTSIDGFPVFFHEIFNSEYQLNVEDVHKLLKSRATSKQDVKTSYSDHAKVISELTKKVNRADIAKLQQRLALLNDDSRETLEVFLNKAKLHNDMAKQMKFREENAYEWSSSKLKSNRTLEGNNFFSPISKGSRNLGKVRKGKEYLLWSSEGVTLISKNNPLGDSTQGPTDMVTVLSKFLKNDLPQLIKVVKAHEGQNWSLIGGKSGENSMLVFERNKTRSFRILKTLKTVFAATGFGFLMLLGLNWLVEDQPILDPVTVKDLDQGVDEIRLLADVDPVTISKVIGDVNSKIGTDTLKGTASEVKEGSSWKSWIWKV